MTLECAGENDYVVKISVRIGKNSKRFHIHSLEVYENQQGLKFHDFRHGVAEFPADDDSIYRREAEVNGVVLNAPGENDV